MEYPLVGIIIASLVGIAFVVGGTFAFLSWKRSHKPRESAFWADYAQAIAAMKEVTRRMYGAQVTDEVFKVEVHVVHRRPGEPHGLYYPDTHTIVIFRGEENHTLNSAFPSEIWEHRLPHVIENDYNANHDPHWDGVRSKLTREAAQLLAAQGRAN